MPQNSLPPSLRSMHVDDLHAVMHIQQTCYGTEFIETRNTLMQRLRSPVNLSCVAEHAGTVCAYLAAYRSTQGKVTPLHGDFMPATPANTLYLHDLAVLPKAKGQGLAQRLIERLWDQARQTGLPYSALVSVQGSQAFWARMGYQVQALHGTAQRHLDTYGAGACYMVKDLST